MKIDRYGAPTLEHPADFLEFRYAGAHFKRATGLHQTAHYKVTIEASGRTYVVTGGHSKRYPYRAWSDEQVPIYTKGDRQAGHYRTLIEAAVLLADFDATMYQPRGETPAVPHAR